MSDGELHGSSDGVVHQRAEVHSFSHHSGARRHGVRDEMVLRMARSKPKKSWSMGNGKAHSGSGGRMGSCKRKQSSLRDDKHGKYTRCNEEGTKICDGVFDHGNATGTWRLGFLPRGNQGALYFVTVKEGVSWSPGTRAEFLSRLVNHASSSNFIIYPREGECHCIVPYQWFLETFGKPQQDRGSTNSCANGPTDAATARWTSGLASIPPKASSTLTRSRKIGGGDFSDFDIPRSPGVPAKNASAYINRKCYESSRKAGGRGPN